MQVRKNISEYKYGGLKGQMVGPFSVFLNCKMLSWQRICSDTKVGRIFQKCLRDKKKCGISNFLCFSPKFQIRFCLDHVNFPHQNLVFNSYASPKRPN